MSKNKQKQARRRIRPCRWFDPGSSHHFTLKELPESVANPEANPEASLSRRPGLRAEHELVLVVALAGHLVLLTGAFLISGLPKWAGFSGAVLLLVILRAARLFRLVAEEIRHEQEEMSAGEMPAEEAGPEGVVRLHPDGSASYVVPMKRKGGAAWPL